MRPTTQESHFELLTMNAIEPRCVALFLLLGWMAVGSDSAVGQCDSPVTVANTSTTLGAGLRTGQSFVAAESGELQSVMLGVCKAVDSQLVIRQEGSGDGATTWNDGSLLGTSQVVSASSTNGNLCHTSIYGSIGYEEHAFDFEGVYIESGQTYVMELISGYAISTQSAPYGEGFAFNSSGVVSSSDLHFEVTLCPMVGLAFGCTDSAACNYDGANAEDGSCLLP